MPSFFHDLSLRNRVSLLILAIVLLSLWSLALFASITLRQDMEPLVGEQQMATAQVIADDLERELRRRLTALETVAARLEASALRSPAKVQHLLSSGPALDALFNGGVTVHGANAAVLADSLADAGHLGRTLEQLPILRSTLQGGQVHISPAWIDRSKAPVLAMAVPVRSSGGAVIGAVLGHIQLDRPSFLDAVRHNSFEAGGTTFLLADRTQRMIIASTDARRVGTSLTAAGQNAAVDRFVGGEEGTAAFTNNIGVDVLASVRQVPSAPWMVAVSTPTATAFAPVHRMQRRLWWGAALVSLLAMALTRWLVARQTTPALYALRELTGRIAEVQRDAPLQLLNVRRNDEIGRLIDAFNALMLAEAQRKALLREVLNTSNVGICACDDAGRITLANDMLMRLFQRPRSVLLGMHYLELVAARERHLARANVAALQADPDTPMDTTRRFLRADGTEFWGQVSLRQFRPSVDGVRGGVCVITDITAQVQSHEYEQFRRRTLEALARNTPLTEALEGIVSGLETLCPPALCSILRVQAGGVRLGSCVAPQLPTALQAILNATEIGPMGGACGAAAHYRERIVVHAEATPDAAQREGLLTCWSQPLLDAQENVLGTLALHHRTARNPSPADIELMEQAAHLASLTITQHLDRQAMADSEARHRAMLEWTPTPMAVHRGGRVVYANRAAARMMAAPDATALLGKPILEFVHPDSRALVLERAKAVASSGVELPVATERFLRFDGQVIDVETLAARFDFDGNPAVLVSMQDVTRRNQAQQRLQLAGQVFDHAREGIMVTDTQGLIIEVNAAFSRITGYDRDEVLGHNPRILKSGRQGRDYYGTMWKTLQASGNWTGEVWNRRKNGEIYAALQTISTVRDAQGRPLNYVSLFSDITLAKEHAQYIERIAHFDVLTNLPNRVLLSDRLHQAMAQSQRRGLLTAVAFLDLDGFKGINDHHGHDTGDQLLMTLAQRMRKALREGDTLARIGGDEFVAVLADLPDTQACVPLLARLLQAAATPVTVDECSLEVSASIGVSFFPQVDEVDADQLLRQADQAMYQAKLAGKNRYHVFDADQDRHVRGHHESLDRIRNALHNREFVLHYQPKVNMRTGEVRGMEALIRWQHPTEGLLAPAAFLPVVEDQPLAVDIGKWVLAEAVRQLDEWQQQGLQLKVSVNIGARQLQHPDFLDQLRSLLAETPQVRPEQIELEVLETSALEDLAHVSSVIQAGNAMGIGFALDDFGTGYSSLSYLKRLPAGLLKIDQSFVRDMLDDPDDLAILDGVIGLASAFRREVIAEGVETEQHGTLLLQLGCEHGQGYGIARPMPARAVRAWVDDWRPAPAWQCAQRVHREDFALLYVMVEHRAWCHAIGAFVRGEGQALSPRELRECRFSRWLDREGAQRYSHHPAFLLMDTLHERLHDHATALHRWAQDGDSERARAGLVELMAMENRLGQQIDRLLTPHTPLPAAA
ncbi:EAL domain-containing protein [Curvibacter sp. APW13]|uniref:EAL domain-containing protein n=1 Tax=Curvibacter sp. APW13 TaxID=3077236 RepID=UPI0028DE36D5|nr:EAL domain-containing protein [Curvibacter sp. APW13]MDT8989844.1 EAL domain-containing protein [Curvibacter sp. APW13]